MSDPATNYFARLNAIDVSEHVDKKGEFSYLSWPYAVQQLRLADQTASWEVRRFDGLPYLKTETGYFVEVAVIVQGITLSQIHPVLDADNRPIPAPTCFDINTSIQRALVKAIALHGLGLCVYAGEDLPQNGKPSTGSPPSPRPSVSELREPSRASASQLRYIRRLVQETGHDLQKLLDFFSVNALEELSQRAASRAIETLQKTKRAA
jgi:hypothetical protein